MFDPTIFDNIKVALENQLYDLDNLGGTIRITNRIDRLEMSVMSREFALFFELAGSGRVTTELCLQASLKDLAAEILEMPDEKPGCALILRFHMKVADVPEQCKQVQDTLVRIWKPENRPTQKLSFVHGQEPVVYENTVELTFNRKINEDQMADLPGLIQHMIQSLRELEDSLQR